MIRLSFEGRGLAFWRPPDVWRYGLASVEWADLWHWAISLGALDVDMADGGHFDSFTLVRWRLGPLRFRLLFIDDLGGGYVESPY